MKMRKATGLWLAFMLVVATSATAQPYTLHGTVTSPDGASDTRVPNATITLQLGNYSGMTDDSGQFSISGVPDGQYEVTIAAEGCGSHMQDLTLQSDKQVVFSLDCAAQQPGGVMFYGTVTRESPEGPTDTPVPGAIVTVEPGGYSMTTDARGNFSFPPLPTGQYHVMASHPSYGSITMDLMLSGSKQVVLGLPGTEPGIDE